MATNALKDERSNQVEQMILQLHCTNLIIEKYSICWCVRCKHVNIHHEFDAPLEVDEEKEKVQNVKIQNVKSITRGHIHICMIW